MPSISEARRTTMRRMLLPFVTITLLLAAMATAAQAQTKISGTNHCAKPDPQNTVQVGDRPNHAFSLGQTKCAWTKPWEIAGIPGKEGVGTFSGEITGNTFRFHAYYVDEMANGDKAYYRYQGTATTKTARRRPKRVRGASFAAPASSRVSQEREPIRALQARMER